MILTIINLPRIIIGFSESERKNTKFNGVNLINYTLMSCLDIFHFSIPKHFGLELLIASGLHWDTRAYNFHIRALLLIRFARCGWRSSVLNWLEQFWKWNWIFLKNGTQWKMKLLSKMLLKMKLTTNNYWNTMENETFHNLIK